MNKDPKSPITEIPPALPAETLNPPIPVKLEQEAPVMNSEKLEMDTDKPEQQTSVGENPDDEYPIVVTPTESPADLESTFSSTFSDAVIVMYCGTTLTPDASDYIEKCSASLKLTDA